VNDQSSGIDARTSRVNCSGVAVTISAVVIVLTAEMMVFTFVQHHVIVIP
jgi:hypothetical protein